ncbi:hypothetical protein AMAG_09155 [Allomyces macrogynus ATCC 38327]|uniref:Uncharacterized protein n=1 Tax=Allomyces macrogynus (strain ATCC 38327) TaxID=578462 RepID=A0A0L0SNK4_ALLM3|nr:hypothetical protein AMAG_09155 [Allomyces macrogynus ATCC 38327]|eukprot:KNE64093.1 hypothetical protein AMAG_09155 [Allomyces macrogynus ATCC 38327]
MGRPLRNSALKRSPSGQRHFKAQAYTTLLFRDYLFQRTHAGTSASLPQRSSDLVARIHNIVEDLMTLGTVAPTRLGDADSNFSGRSLRPILDKLHLAPSVLQRGKRFDSMALLSFVEEVV